MTLHRLPAVALAVLAAIFSSGGRAEETQAIKVGVQLPVTGERASVGRLMLNGLQMALSKINGQAGRDGPRFELVLADDESTPDGAVQAIVKLSQDPGIIAVAGEINSPYVIASAPVIEKEGLPYLTGGSSPKTTAQSQWIFRVGASDALLAEFITNYIADVLKAKSVAILHDKTGIHNQRADLVASVLKQKYGIVPVVNAAWNPGDRDFSVQIGQIKMASPAAILALGETPEGASFFKAVKIAGIQAQVIAQRDFGVKRVLNEAGGATEGALIFTEYAPDLQSPETQAWNAAYKKLYGDDANVIAAQYYDSLLLLAEAVKTGGPSRLGVKSGLEQLKQFPGVMADYTFDAGRNGVHRFYLARVAAGRLSLVRTLSEDPKQ